MATEEDSVIIERVKSGNTAAFALLVDRYKDMVNTVSYRIVKNVEDAEEVTQDTFLKAFQKIDSYKGDSKFSTWIYSIAFNASISKTRKKRLEFSDIDTNESDVFVEGSASQLTLLKEEEQKKYISMALNQMPSDDALLLSLFYLQECSVEEIHEITALSHSNIKVKLHRSRKKFYQQLELLLNQEIKTLL
jgi:RNA polymerase sigma factor (sigma-70 family)